MNELMDKLCKTGSIKQSSILSESKFFNEKDMVQTDIPSLNIALSGSVDGGLTPGITFIAGPSKTYKTLMSLRLVTAYLNKYKDAVCIFYDSEFGTSNEYLQLQGVDTSRVVHIPVTDVEQFKFDIVAKLKEINDKDHVIFFVDSIGNMASKKEIEDAIEEKSVADMSRAKAVKSVFRMITPHLTLKNIPMICINHVYMEIGMYPKAIMGGGTGPLYSANTVWLITKAQEKSGTELEGFTFTINIEKSRFVEEKAKIPLRVTFDNGIDYYSGLLDIALESGHIVKPSNGWYQLKGSVDKVREKNTGALLDVCLQDPEFKMFIENKYRLVKKYNKSGALSSNSSTDVFEVIADE